MLNNSQNILTELVEYRRSQTAPEMKKSTFFNFFVVGETLKDYDLSYDEIESGIVDRGDDGGIDSIHIFANGQLIEGDSDIEQLGRNARIELYVFQSKLENGFSEIALERIDASVRELLDLSNDLQDFKQSYNADLLEAVKIFRELYKQIALTLPYLRIKYLYCTNGIEVHPKVKRKAERLIRTTKSLFTPCDVKVEFVGASELLDWKSVV